MENYVAPGEVVELTAPTGGVVSGTAYLIGGLVIVALVTAAVEHAKVSAQAWTEGAKLYWDDTAKNFTTTASGNTLVGVAAAAAANPSATGKIRLDGVTR